METVREKSTDKGVDESENKKTETESINALCALLLVLTCFIFVVLL